MRRRGLLGLTVLGVLLVGCGHRPAPVVAESFVTTSLEADQSKTVTGGARNTWLLQSSQWCKAAPPVLADGKIGARIGPFGVGADNQGSPLPSFADGLYDAKENIQSVDQPSIVATGMTQVSRYEQDLSMQTGFLHESWDASVNGSTARFDGNTVAYGNFFYCVWSVKGHPGDSLAIEIRGRYSAKVGPHNDVYILLPKDAGSTTTSTPNVNLDREGNGAIAFVWTPLEKGSLERSVQSIDDVYAIMRDAATASVHEESSSIQIDGPDQDAQAVQSFLFYVRRLEGRFISPMGLSSAKYNGHVFWDADTWIAPSLYFFDPGLVATLATYRATHMRGSAQLGPFPWESAVTGKELGAVMAKEIHIDGDVAIGLHNDACLGLAPQQEADRVAAKVARFYQSKLVPAPGGEWSLPDVVSPDENHTGDNDLYTNLVAQFVLNGLSWNPPQKYQMALPKDAISLLTYDHDPLRGYRQAAAILSIFPLQFPEAEKEASVMVDRFGSKVAPNGPAMSQSIEALIRARLGQTNAAYSEWESSWKDYVQTPFLLFSEKQGRPYDYFATGAAGCLQTVEYGFAGLRISQLPDPRASFKKKLLNGEWLSVSPHLPNSWRALTFHRFHLLGNDYELVIRRANQQGYAVQFIPWPKRPTTSRPN